LEALAEPVEVVAGGVVVLVEVVVEVGAAVVVVVVVVAGVMAGFRLSVAGVVVEETNGLTNET
jgi:uncharacterized membrane protein